MSRLVASEAHISARNANIPALVTPDEMQRIKAFFEKLNDWGLFVDDSYSLPVSQIAARARR
jgi:replicative DNA helicase